MGLLRLFSKEEEGTKKRTNREGIAEFLSSGLSSWPLCCPQGTGGDQLWPLLGSRISAATVSALIGTQGTSQSDAASKDW